jgi:oligoendopeptidase F
MDYKGFNIAIHELGHNVEQVISLHEVDHTLLQGVPNTAFTEALAFVFQAQDLRLLGLAAADEHADALKALNDFWATCEIAGVALVDMAVWHWMYDHPKATPAELRESTLTIARDVWNRYYAPVFGKKDVDLLAIYSHMIHSFLYLPDYPIGHLIAHQIEEKVKMAGTIGPEFERMARQGRIAPDLWMTGATGAPVGADALLTAAERALRAVSGKK